MQVLLYDDKEMRIYEVANFLPQPAGYTEFDVTGLEDNFRQVAIVPNHTYMAELMIRESKSELDPTTMKRIAKYNLDKDFEAINSRTAKALEYLANLDRQVEEKEEKLAVTRKLVQEIWDDKCFESDKYLYGDCGEE